MQEPLVVRYELWKGPEGFSFFPESNEEARSLLHPAAKLVWSCTAFSWEEAQMKKHNYLKWEPYVPR